jgi:hypothetical protein
MDKAGGRQAERQTFGVANLHAANPVYRPKYYTLERRYPRTIQFNLPYLVKRVIRMPDSASHSPTPPMLEIQLPDMANSTSLALPIQPPNPAVQLIGCLQPPMRPFN